MRTKIIESKSIFTEQSGGFLSTGPFPFTHTASPYTGCGFGNTYCGTYCYAPSLANWTQGAGMDEKWGNFVIIKGNAGKLAAEALARMKPETRAGLRVFMASTTDPYQPLEAQHKITRSILEAFSQYTEIGLLVIQTRSNLVERDFDLIAKLPYAWLSMTVETDDEEVLRKFAPVGIPPQQRFDTLLAAKRAGINTQLVSSPTLPASYDFPSKIIKLNPDRVIIDTFSEGDGSRGERTKHSQFAQKATYDWQDDKAAKRLFGRLREENKFKVGWSASGFCGIPSYTKKNVQPSLF